MPRPLLRLLVATLLLTWVAAQFDFNDFAAFKDQRCKAFQCEKGYEAVPKKTHAYKSAGCNAMGGDVLSMMGGSDDDEEEKPIYESCCHFFHACHQICGTVSRNCDRDYDRCVQTACRQKQNKTTTDDHAYNLCMDDAQQHAMMLQLTGCKSHFVEQSKYCACSTKYGNQHVKRREETLSNFYKLHVPKDGASEKKVKELIEKKKVDTAPKLAKLLVALVQKYPHAVEIEEDRQSKMFRQMFTGMGGGDEDEDGDQSGGKWNESNEDGDIEDFDVDEDLGSYNEEEEEGDDDEEEEAELLLQQAELLKKKAEKLKAERNKKKRKMEEQKKKGRPPPVEEAVVAEDTPHEDEYNQ